MPINGLVVITPSSIAYSGTSASINADGSVDFSAVTSLSLNGVFTSDYDNYMISIRHLGSANAAIRYRLRVSGEDNSTASSYTRQSINVSDTTVSTNSASDDNGLIGNSQSSNMNGDTVLFFGPYLTQRTATRSMNIKSNSGASFYDYATTHSQSTSYDGFTIYPNSGNLTGIMTVFGFNQ